MFFCAKILVSLLSKETRILAQKNISKETRILAQKNTVSLSVVASKDVC